MLTHSDEAVLGVSLCQSSVLREILHSCHNMYFHPIRIHCIIILDILYILEVLEREDTTTDGVCVAGVGAA